MRYLRMHWLALTIVGIYLYFAYESGYWPFAGSGSGTSSFSLTST